MDVYERVRQNILAGEAEEVSKIVKELVNLKYPPEKILQEGLINRKKSCENGGFNSWCRSYRLRNRC